jgi:hypothetical protein
MPNDMRLRRLSRVEGPPHSCAPETSPVQPLSVRSHSWSTVPGSGPPMMSVSSYRWRPQTASLIHRSDPVPPFNSRRCSSATLPCHLQAWSTAANTPMPSGICGLPSSQLGCMRERNTLSILLHQYWSRFPSLSLSQGLRLLHNRSPSLSLRGMVRRIHHLAIHICKPPRSPPTVGRFERRYLLS